jgi:hypothetical protein
MRKLPVVIAAASTLCVFPALAAPPETGSQPPFGMQRDLGGTKGSLKGSLGERGARGMFMKEGCKYVTIRQRQGDTVTIRRFKRCD